MSVLQFADSFFIKTNMKVQPVYIFVVFVNRPKISLNFSSLSFPHLFYPATVSPLFLKAELFCLAFPEISTLDDCGHVPHLPLLSHYVVPQRFFIMLVSLSPVAVILEGLWS